MNVYKTCEALAIQYAFRYIFIPQGEKRCPPLTQPLTPVYEGVVVVTVLYGAETWGRERK